MSSIVSVVVLTKVDSMLTSEIRNSKAETYRYFGSASEGCDHGFVVVLEPRFIDKLPPTLISVITSELYNANSVASEPNTSFLPGVRKEETGREGI